MSIKCSDLPPIAAPFAGGQAKGKQIALPNVQINVSPGGTCLWADR